MSGKTCLAGADFLTTDRNGRSRRGTAFNKWRFSYSGVGAEHPANHRAVIEHDGLRTRVVAMLEESAAVRVAAELVEGYAQYVELGGAFKAATVARVVEAAGGRVPVGAVNYTAWSP